MITFVNQDFSHGLVHNSIECRLIGATELIVEAADNVFGILNQFISDQDQMPRRRMRVQGFDGIFVPVFCKIQDLINVQVTFSRVGELAARIIDQRDGGR